MTEQRRDQEEARITESRRFWLSALVFDSEQAKAMAVGGQSRSDAIANAMGRAALELSGQVGFRQVTVERLLERSGSNRERFYRSYANLAACYTAAYAPTIDELVDLMLRSGANAETWPSGVRRAMEALADFAASEPDLARGVIAEVSSVGGGAVEKRQTVIARLARAMETGRLASGRPVRVPPPITAEFVLFGIESVLIRCLRERAPVRDVLQGAVYLAVAPYLGPSVALAETRRIA
ncbi:MAG TPA: hypothetical protein VGH14_04770 [Solirubrobacterales bacterium]|jgi:AcrR family transcriptional regulator